MRVMRNSKEALSRAASSLGVEVAPEEVPLEFPADLSHGDFSSGIALSFAKKAGRAPRLFAEEIVASLEAIEGVGRVVVAGPGFINFTLSSEAYAEAVEQARTDPSWGRGTLNAGKRVMVEYTDPNPFKEFHIGHLMANAVGEAIVRLLEFSGAEVKRANYQGDVGGHVAKAIWGVRKLGLDARDVGALGKAYAEGAKRYESDEAAKKEIGAINAKVYDRSDPEINELYDTGRAASLSHFEELYKVLGTRFDFYFFESEAAPRGKRLVEAYESVFEKSEGALVYRGEGEGLHTRVFITSKGLPTYEAKELGLLEMKEAAWDFDRSVVVTAEEQREYFRVVLSAARRILPEVAGKTTHLTHGMMRFAEGKMSSRTGNVITGESLLGELTKVAKGRASESRAREPEKLAQEVAVAAIKYQILKQASGKDIVFDRARALSLEGDSGPYLQYAHARACAVVERARSEGVRAFSGASEQPEEVARLLVRFSYVVERAAAALEPHLVATYLVELAAAFNRWYAKEKILDGTPEASRKVALADAVRATLRQGLWLLGIPAPERM